MLAFAEEAKCVNIKVADVPDVQKKLVGYDTCDLTTGGIESIKRVKDTI